MNSRILFMLFILLPLVILISQTTTAEEPEVEDQDVLSGTFPSVTSPDPLIQAMIDQVESDTVYQYDGNLSGEWPVMIGGEPYTIVTRHTDSGEPIEKATQFVGEHLSERGLDVEYHLWDADRPPNVIGELPGETNPDEIFIISAHLDSLPAGGVAPGADDNASGSVAVLIASDILTQYDWGCTLRFAFWTGEEQGLLGSRAYALRAFNNNENIVALLNLDMIAWNTPGSAPDMDLHANSNITPTVELAELFADVVDVYDLALIPQIIPNGTTRSDHGSFWLHGYTAILAIEDFSANPDSPNDFNPNYHSTGDTLELLDLDYFTNLVKASVGTFAHSSGCLIPETLGFLEGHVTAASSSAPLAEATVSVTDMAGRTFLSTTDATGYYTSTLPTGTITVTASADGYLPTTITNLAILSNTISTQNFALQEGAPLAIGSTNFKISTNSRNFTILLIAIAGITSLTGWLYVRRS